MTRSLLVVGAAVAAAVSFAAPVHGQGSSVYTQSACMSARNGAGVASPCTDGSAIFFNPAALALQPGALGLGVTMIRASNEFFYDDDRLPSLKRDAETIPVPHAYLQYRFNERLGVGIGAWAPYGLGIEWPVCAGDQPNCGDPNFEGRFTGYDNSLRGLYIQPTLAYQLVPNRVSVGVGVDFVRGSLEINRRQDLSEVAIPGQGGATFGNLGIPVGTDFAEVELSGDGSAVTGHVALLARITDALSIGARYMHEAEIDFDEGTADFRQVSTGLTLPAGNPLGAPAGTPVDAVVAAQFAEGGMLVDQSVKTSLTFPAQAVVGVSFGMTPGLKLLADYQWIGWSSFDQAEVEFGVLPSDVIDFGYEDTHTYRLGADFQATDALALRAGFVYNTAASPRPNPLLPEAERNYYSAGLGYNVTDRLGLDAMVMFVDQAVARGSVRPGGPEVGHYTSDAFIYGATFKYRIGRSIP